MIIDEKNLKKGELPVNKIILGDATEVLKKLPYNSVDAIVTDPPYGLKFMGKKWDYNVPSIGLWKEVLRVLKPGGHLLSFFGTRTYHRGVMNIEDTGFEIRDMILWLYGSGFPKSMDISKAIDKEFGKLDEREVISIGRRQGKNPPHHMGRISDWREKSDVWEITAPATPEAKKWQGWGTALKPACEPIVLARKPISEKNITQNVLKWETGGLNIDECRIGNEIIPAQKRGNAVSVSFQSGGFTPEHQGRFPANVILECICDEVIEGKVKPERIGRKGGNKGSFGAWAGSTENSIGRWPADKQIIHTNPECPCYMLDEQSGTTARVFGRRFILTMKINLIMLYLILEMVQKNA
jgi:site-specific DNA-methyltransferase (adenine-specific)